MSGVVRDTNPDLDVIEQEALLVIGDGGQSNVSGLAQRVLALVAALRVEVGRREKAETALDKLVKAALNVVGRELDGTWVVYADEHGDLAREFLIPAVRAVVGETDLEETKD